MPTATVELDELSTRILAARDGDQRTYAKAVHGHDYEEYQEAWVEALETENRIVIVCPPDTRKSTTVRQFVERAIGKNKNSRILWLMHSGDQAKRHVMSIAQTLTGNTVYKRAFDVKPDSTAEWSKSSLFVERDIADPNPTIMATGFNGPYQGFHFDTIIIDDPTDQEDVRSPTEMEHQRNKVRGVILDRLFEGGRIVVILTPWGENDLIATFAEMGFRIVRMPVVGDYPWGPTLSSTRFTPERIEQIRRDKGDRLFTLTFLLDTGAETGNIISRDHIGYYEPDMVLDEHLHVFMGVDPAATKNTWSDFSAIATVGISLKKRTIYLLDMFAKRMETPDLEFEIIKRVNRTAGLQKVGLETSGFQISILQRLRRAHPRLKHTFKELPYRSRRESMTTGVALDRDKEGRAMYIDSLLSQGKLLFPRNLPAVDGVSLESELCAVPEGKHDDRMDALAFACVLAENYIKWRRPKGIQTIADLLRR